MLFSYGIFVPLSFWGVCSQALGGQDESSFPSDDSEDYVYMKVRRPSWPGTEKRRSEYYSKLFSGQKQKNELDGKVEKTRRDYSVPSYDHHGGYAGSSHHEIDKVELIAPLALLVAPLAGLVLLATAAAAAINPLLFNIPLLGGVGRRRRQAEELLGSDLQKHLTPNIKQKILELEVLESFLSKIPGEKDVQKEVMATYMSCSGYPNDYCLDYAVCEFGNDLSTMSHEDKDVIAIILYNILTNRYVDDAYKQRLKSATHYGRNNRSCYKFDCPLLKQNEKVPIQQ